MQKKLFRTYIFPALYGLMVYLTVRLLEDTQSGIKSWERDLQSSLLELTFSILTGYLGIWLFRRLFNYFDKKWLPIFSYPIVIKEITLLVLANIVLLNLIFTPLSALTDDGLSWSDVVKINLIPTLYAIGYYGITRSKTYMQAYIANSLQLEKVKNEHLETELKFLKSQYHPHFLFNALNTIYFQMDENIADAKISIEKFSDLLRYQLYDQQQLVPMRREIEYLRSFIELQKARSSAELELQTIFDDALNGQMVYPLLFLPFVENAFKFIGGDYKMLITAEVKNGMVVFKVENSIPDSLPVPITEGAGGIGLTNLKRRMDLLYPGKHEFSTTTVNNVFIAQLRIKHE